VKRAVLLAALAIMLCAAAPVDRALLAGQLAALSDAGNGEATYHLAMMKHLGIGGAKDEKTAFDLFRKSAEAGDPLGAYKLGCYFAGQGEAIVEPDPALALQYKLVAAEAGYALAQHDVAKHYFDVGETDLALEWLTRSAGQGFGDALRALASLHNSDAIPKDAARTYAYFTLYLARIATPTDKQKQFLADFTDKMSEEDKARGDRIIADWHAEASPLTVKALSGLRAAEALVAAPGH